MARWSALETSAPELATAARALIFRGGDGEAVLATVRGEEAPRIHPVNVGIVDGGLYAFILRSAKLVDLERDGRYALHSHVDPAAPSELMLRGRAREVTDQRVRGAVAASWPFGVDDTYRLFEFDIDDALLGRRDSAEEWPPRYVRWRG